MCLEENVKRMIFELPIRAQTCASALHPKLAEKDPRGMMED
jgi:hypothetical protein